MVTGADDDGDGDGDGGLSPDRYEKTVHLIPMRDGVRLCTVVYAPRDRSTRYPFLITRTPYGIGPYELELPHEDIDVAPSSRFIEDGYIFVLQDARGAHRSEGVFEDFRPLADVDDPAPIDETTDTYDAIEWLLANIDGHNGRVGLWGHSYAGWYTVMGLVDPHPALRAGSPQSTTGDAFIGDDNHQNGAFFLFGSLEWASSTVIVTDGEDRGKQIRAWPDGFPYPSSSSYEFFLTAGPTDSLDDRYFGGRLMKGWDDLMAHPDYDEYWQRRNIMARLTRVNVPVLHVAAWFDGADPYGTIATYQAIGEQNPGVENVLVAGPWSHGDQLGSGGSRVLDVDFGSATAEHYREDIVFPFFQHHLKDEGDWSAPGAIAFETGRDRWHHLASWPPPDTTELPVYLRAEGLLGFDPPSEPSDAADRYVSDPSSPVPYTPWTSMAGGHEYVIADQRYLLDRDDVLTYRSEPLTQDLCIAGAVRAELEVSTTGTDADWFVKVIDAYPDEDSSSPGGHGMSDYHMLVVPSVMRGRYRNSFRVPEPMVPEERTSISFDLWHRFHTFRQGHRLVVQIHSTWFPIFDRNPQTFMNIYGARASDYQSATHSVHRSVDAPSRLLLPVYRPQDQ